MRGDAPGTLGTLRGVLATPLPQAVEAPPPYQSPSPPHSLQELAPGKRPS